MQQGKKFLAEGNPQRAIGAFREAESHFDMSGDRPEQHEAEAMMEKCRKHKAYDTKLLPV